MTLEVLSRPSLAPTGPGPLQPARRARKNVLDLDDFSVQEIEAVLDTAAAMKDVLHRPIKKVPTLRGKTLVTLFYEASTRTRVGFEVAAKALGADTVSVAASTSSVINAGDGWHAHPTQALLDLFTIRERLGRIGGLRVAIVGDILHSRVARSNLWGLTLMGADVVLCGPPTMLPEPSFCAGGLPWELERTYHMDEALDGADVVMLLRMQLERQSGGLFPSLREDGRTYALTEERLARAKPGALVMHPGPMNEGVEIDPRVARSAQSVIETQVTNGVAVRMALLYLLSGLSA